MTRRISLQGASDDDVAQLRELLNRGIPGLHSTWKFHAGADVDLLVVDIDTVYGHMDWLRAHSAGKAVAVLTSHAQFGDADLILHKPFSLENLADILNRVDAIVPARPAGDIAHDEPPTPVAPLSTPVAAPAPPVAAPRERRLADWLAEGALERPARLREGGAPDLVLDPSAREFHADATLRALAPYCTRAIAAEEWQPLEAADLASVQSAGKAQPYARLLWLCHALGSNGQLAPGLDSAARYKLARWPQIEREFPKHFRIATVMLKQPATLGEIAEQSGATLADVIDFTNAYNATGYIEIEGVRAAEPAQRDTGRGAILSRLRNPFGGS